MCCLYLNKCTKIDKNKFCFECTAIPFCEEIPKIKKNIILRKQSIKRLIEHSKTLGW